MVFMLSQIRHKINHHDQSLLLLSALADRVQVSVWPDVCGQKRRLVLQIPAAIPNRLPVIIYHRVRSASTGYREFGQRVWQVEQHPLYGAASEYQDGVARCRMRCRARQPESGQIVARPTSHVVWHHRPPGVQRVAVCRGFR